MTDRVGCLLTAMKTGDGAAAHALLDLLQESGDHRFKMVRSSWERKLKELAEEVGVQWTEHAPRIRFPNWRDAIIPVMGTLPLLAGHQLSSRCPKAHSVEVNSLVNGFADLLTRLGCCQAIEGFVDEGVPCCRFHFQYRDPGLVV